MDIVALLLAVGAAMSNALTTILQRLGVQSAPAGSELRWRLVRHVLRRPVWFLGMGTMIGGFALQAIALGRGDLSLVQPVMVSELVFLVLLLRVWFRRTLGWRELAGTLATVAGLGTFLAVGDAGGGTSLPSARIWALLTSVVAAAVLVSVLLTRRGGRVWRSAWFGAAAALSFALCAAFTKTATILFAGGFLQLFTHWQTYGIAVAGGAGLFLAQNAFYSGPITASQATLTIADPIASIAIGAGVFGDQLRHGSLALLVEVVALATMIAGLVLLCHSPLIADALRQERLERPPRRPPVAAPAVGAAAGAAAPPRRTSA